MGTIHGHYGTYLEQEAQRIKKLYKELLNIDITWREATDLAGIRSENTFFPEKKLRTELMKLRGIQ